MAVYKRSYKGYTGGFTPTWSRFLILPRYGYARIFQSKFIIMFLVACFFFPLGDLAYIYLAHNLSILREMVMHALRKEPLKLSLRRKRRRASLDQSFRPDLLALLHA